MKVLVCGDRNWKNVELVYDELIKLPEKTRIIHGAAKGADTIAGEVARGIGFRVIAYPADWDKFGKSAGPIRNREMLKEKPDLIIAFHSDIANSKGTKDMIFIGNKKGVKVILISDR